MEILEQVFFVVQWKILYYEIQIGILGLDLHSYVEMDNATLSQILIHPL